MESPGKGQGPISLILWPPGSLPQGVKEPLISPDRPNWLKWEGLGAKAGRGPLTGAGGVECG